MTLERAEQGPHHKPETMRRVPCLPRDHHHPDGLAIST